MQGGADLGYPHALTCQCEGCWHEFRARFPQLTEEKARRVFEAGKRAAARVRGGGR